MDKFGAAGSGNGQFSTPKAVAVSPVDGDIAVADFANNRISLSSTDCVGEAEPGPPRKGRSPLQPSPIPRVGGFPVVPDRSTFLQDRGSHGPCRGPTPPARGLGAPPGRGPAHRGGPGQPGGAGAARRGQGPLARLPPGRERARPAPCSWWACSARARTWWCTASSSAGEFDGLQRELPQGLRPLPPAAPMPRSPSWCAPAATPTCSSSRCATPTASASWSTGWPPPHRHPGPHPLGLPRRRRPGPLRGGEVRRREPAGHAGHRRRRRRRLVAARRPHRRAPRRAGLLRLGRR